MQKTISRFAATLGGLVLGAALAATAAEPPVEGKEMATAIFAGGCFWCMEPPFDDLPGVVSTTSGYTGGHKVNPTYKEVSGGGTGHIESVRVVYDPAKIGYDKLLEVYWRNVDPVDSGGQFCDRGHEYTTAIFYLNDEQKKLAEASKGTIEKRLKRTVATKIRPAATFYPAEDYHQDYYVKNPVRYKFYRYSCGRDKRLEQLWSEKG